MEKVASKDVIGYIRDNVDKSNYVSLSVLGSIPDIITATKDLDILFVIRASTKDSFFDNLTEKMCQFIKHNSGVAYTLFRGPIKYKNKGLIHILVYTYGKRFERTNKELFLSEQTPVLKNFLHQSIPLSGTPLTKLLKGLDLNEDRAVQSSLNKLREKLSILQKQNRINYPEWKRTREGWKLLRINKKCSAFLREYLTEYYNKQLEAQK